MKNILLIALSFVSLSLFASEFRNEPHVMAAVGVRGGKSDINDNPAMYGSLKMEWLAYQGSNHSIVLFTPGVGVQPNRGRVNINFSVSPIAFKGNNDWSFGVDVFVNTKTAKDGNGNLGFFIGKGF